MEPKLKPDQFNTLMKAQYTLMDCLSKGSAREEGDAEVESAINDIKQLVKSLT